MDAITLLNELLRAMSDRVRKFLAREDEALAAPDAGEARAEADCLVSLVRDLSAEYAAAKRRRGRLDFSGKKAFICGKPLHFFQIVRQSYSPRRRRKICAANGNCCSPAGGSVGKPPTPFSSTPLINRYLSLTPTLAG